jgi:hypothetical protein
MSDFRTIETAFLSQIEATIELPTMRRGGIRHDNRHIEFVTPDNKVVTMRLLIYSRGIYRLTSMLAVDFRSRHRNLKRPGWHMELNALPGEVETVTPFFVAFHQAHMHNDASRLIPPPVELWHTNSPLNKGELHSSGYEWTLAAANAYDAWKDRPRP